MQWGFGGRCDLFWGRSCTVEGTVPPARTQAGWCRCASAAAAADSCEQSAAANGRQAAVAAAAAAATKGMNVQAGAATGYLAAAGVGEYDRTRALERAGVVGPGDD